MAIKILIVNRALGTLYGGGESFDLNTAKYLEMNGNEAEILTGRPIFKNDYKHYDNTNIHYIRSPQLRDIFYKLEKKSVFLSAVTYNLDNFLFQVMAFIWILSKKKLDEVDIVQCCALFNLPKWLLRLSNESIILSSWLPGPPSRRDRKKIKGLIRNRNFLLFTHGTPENHLKDELKLQKGVDFFIVEPGIELPISDIAINKTSVLNIPRNSILGITVARFVPIKNHTVLIDALSKAMQKEEFHWVLIGEGPCEEEIKKRIKHYGLEKRIHLVGFCSPEMVHAWLKSCDLFCLTSKYENFSISLLEAMYYGLPVVCTNVGYIQRMVENSGGGLLADSENPEQISSSILTLIRNVSMRNEMKALNQKYSNDYTWPKISKKLYDLYTQKIKEITRLYSKDESIYKEKI